MGRKTPAWPYHPEWTTARFWSFIRSALRRAWVNYPPKREFEKRNRRPYTGSDKRTKWEYQCNNCKQWFKRKDVQVDHIKDVGTLRKKEDLPGFVERLFFVEDKDLQFLCSECHKAKNNKNRKQ
jgi:5-methylcytosine-specific restriction endonuclease McrA